MRLLAFALSTRLTGMAKAAPDSRATEERLAKSLLTYPDQPNMVAVILSRTTAPCPIT